ncbi:MAG: aa3-type cytochrome c oxidase subunit IV [Pseudomonadota bacterium]|nr:aa3-type cytochrome c oxidase subunit IV [Pseudomonadota bacterium]
MADHTNMKPHEQTYNSVMALFKYGALGCLIIAGLVIWLISHK